MKSAAFPVHDNESLIKKQADDVEARSDSFLFLFRLFSLNSCHSSSLSLIRFLNFIWTLSTHKLSRSFCAMRRPWQYQKTIYITILLTCLLAPATYAIKCYRCTIKPPEYIGDLDQPCSKFSSSSRFYHDCPTSTFCMKHIIHYQLPNGSIKTTSERDCAPQKYIIRDYNFDEKKWQAKELIDTEVYKDGCFSEENRGTPNGPSQYCYCSSDYCNTSSTNYNPIQLQIVCFLVIVVLPFLSTS